MHDELDFVLVPLRPGRGEVHQPREQLHAVSDHVEVQLPLGEDDGRLEHDLRLPELPVDVAGHGRALTAGPSTEDQDEFYSFLWPELNKYNP